MCDYLHWVYHQKNDAHHFQLQWEILDIASGKETIQEYYYGLWYCGWSMHPDSMQQTKDSLSSIQKVINEMTQAHQFLMQPWWEFEPLRANLDTYLQSLLAGIEYSVLFAYKKGVLGK